MITTINMQDTLTTPPTVLVAQLSIFAAILRQRFRPLLRSHITLRMVQLELASTRLEA